MMCIVARLVFMACSVRVCLSDLCIHTVWLVCVPGVMDVVLCV